MLIKIKVWNDVTVNNQDQIFQEFKPGFSKLINCNSFSSCSDIGAIQEDKC